MKYKPELCLFGNVARVYAELTKTNNKVFNNKVEADSKLYENLVEADKTTI